MPCPGIGWGNPGSVIERRNHEAERSGPVNLINYAPFIFTHILIICVSLFRTTTLLHPTMKHLNQMFRNYFDLILLFPGSFVTPLPLHRLWAPTVVIQAPGTKCSRIWNRPVKKIFPLSALNGDRTRYPWICNWECHDHEAKRSRPVRLVNYAPNIYLQTYWLFILRFAPLLHGVRKNLAKKFI